LNNRTESREASFVTNLRALRKKFTNSSTLTVAKPVFQSAWSHYGDKWLVTRSFSRFFFRVTPRPVFPDQKPNTAVWMEKRGLVHAQRNVSPAAKLHQVKIPIEKTILPTDHGARRVQKEISPAMPGL